MSVVEFSKLYPYTPGAKGIDFSSLTCDGGRNLIAGGSGNRLEVLWGKSAIRVEEDRLGVDKCRMVARISLNGTLSMDLKTKGYANQPDLRHPDMFARQFITFALASFRQTAGIINAFQSSWNADSDNYVDFVTAINRGLSRQDAAMSTWTGRSFSKHGFLVLREEDVIVDLQHAYVSARFTNLGR